jgi:hypothetical protein
VASADLQINVMAKQLCSLERLERGLMQELLTGRVRVNANNR